MKLLFGFLVWVILWLMMNESYAAPGFRFEQAMLSTAWKTDQGLETALSSKLEGDWSWLLFSLNNRLYLQSENDNYNDLTTRYTFPNISRDLAFSLNYRWNHDYSILGAKTSYHWPVFKDVDLECMIGNNSRMGLQADNQEYRYWQDCQELKFDYSPRNWRYRFKINRTNRDYADYGYYSSLKMLLDQDISWQTAEFEIGLGYKEETGDYPYDQTEVEKDRNYWKQKWLIHGAKDFGKQYKLTWKYYDIYYIKGFTDPYRTEERLELKGVYQPNPHWDFTIQTRFANLYYASPTPDYYEPGDINNDDEDLNSRQEQVYGLACKYRADHFKIEIGGNLGDYHYTQKDTEWSSSVYASLEWNLDRDKRYTLLSTIAPMGDLQHRSGFYQLKLKYLPKQQKKESNTLDLDKLYENEEEKF